MLREILGLTLLLTAAPALAEDWRFVSVDATDEIMAFVDIDSIRTSDANTRTAWMLHVQRTVDDLGVGARRYEVIVDCAGRRGLVVRVVTYDMANREIESFDGDGRWGDMSEGTQGGELREYACSNGASHPEAPSMGSSPPLEIARRVMMDRASQRR